MAFVKAVKYDAKARVALSGPSGSGKTYTALTLAHALAGGGQVAMIDTERGSASKYADQFPAFDVMEMTNFHPDKFVAGIKEAEEGGYAVLVIDSLSHAWNGTGGLLEIVDQIAKRKYQSNSFAAWKDATPIQNALLDALTSSPLHIIVTMRSKQEYVLEKDEKTGKSTPKKMGMAPIQRDGLEYEFDVVADMDIDNTMIVTKSRCSALSGAVIAKPGPKVADVLKAWLQGSGEAPVKPPQAHQPAQSAADELVSSDEQNALFERAKAAGAVISGPGSGAAFLAFLAKELGRPIDRTSKLTRDEAYRVDLAIAAKKQQSAA